MSERGVSDVVGFTLMFSIIILSVAIVSTVGITQLSELSDREKINSAERGMESFAGALDDITRHGDLARRTTLSPSGGTVWFNDSHLTVTVDGGGPYDERMQINSFEHRHTRNPTDVSVAYEGGGVYRSDGVVALIRPQWRCSPGDTAAITVVNLTAGDGLAVNNAFGRDTGEPRPPGADIPSGEIESTDTGITFDAVMDPDLTSLAYTSDGPTRTVSVDVSETANPSQWAFHLDRRGGWTESSSNPHVFECQTVETVVVRVVTVDLHYLGG